MSEINDDVNIRLATADDLPEVYRLEARTFGVQSGAGDVEAWMRRVEVEDVLVAEDTSDPDEPFLVGTSLCYRLQLTVPGGAGVRAAWLAMTAVAAPHQGHGIWQQVSTQGFAILQERGYPVICGVPTDPTVYQILGGGVASYARTYVIDPRRAKLRCAPGPGRAREMNASQAARCLPEIYDRWRAVTSGALRRSDAWWADFLEDRVTQRDRGSALGFIVHPDGFLAYRVFGAAAHAFRPPFGRVVVEDFCPVTDAAHTDLLAALLSMDMFESIEVEVPIDDPLPLKLNDPRAARTTDVTDFLWLRIMDIPDVLGARTYAADVDVVLEVGDPLGVAGGRFLLQTSSGAGKCVRADDESPDVELSLADLATIYLGAHRATELHRGGRITQLRSGAVADLNAAFATERAPYCGTVF